MNDNKSTLRYKGRFGLLVISFSIIIVDQITKYIARSNLHLYDQKEVFGFWNWTLTFNQGAAFSLFADQGGWQRVFFGIIAILVSVWLVYYILNKTYSTAIGIAVSFILGGALGNLVDRILFGEVTDFIDWHAGMYHWPAFNIADSFITVGVGIILIEQLFFAKKPNDD